MTNVWFTSDTHFHHTKALLFRPSFSTVDEMNETIIQNWNRVVRKGDQVYHLGDFSWNKGDRIAELLKRLNGQVHLICGNHDKNLNSADRARFASFNLAKYIKVQGQKIYLHHCACRVWWSSHHGSWHLYGHSHGNLPDDPNALSMDVGVDTNNFELYSFEDIRERMKLKTFVPVDHHG